MIPARPNDPSSDAFLKLLQAWDREASRLQAPVIADWPEPWYAGRETAVDPERDYAYVYADRR